MKPKTAHEGEFLVLTFIEEREVRVKTRVNTKAFSF